MSGWNGGPPDSRWSGEVGCERALVALSDLGERDPAAMPIASGELAAHLQACPSCRQAARAMQLVRLGLQGERIPPSPLTDAAFVERFWERAAAARFGAGGGHVATPLLRRPIRVALLSLAAAAATVLALQVAPRGLLDDDDSPLLRAAVDEPTATRVVTDTRPTTANADAAALEEALTAKLGALGDEDLALLGLISDELTPGAGGGWSATGVLGAYDQAGYDVTGLESALSNGEGVGS
ncbi:MAG: hypothetical protein HYV63_10100 [Candidatus Schekmanbacteria bacterium]|nr:hypothetical protein [Candidatus Schekmanbacteria bacterium]